MTRVVMAGEPHAAVLDHDHIEPGERGTPAKRPVEGNRGSPGTARDDQQWMRGFPSGAHVMDVEFIR